MFNQIRPLLQVDSFINFYSCSVRQIAVYRTSIYTFSEPLIYLSCFIFWYKVIEYQSFQKVVFASLLLSIIYILNGRKVIAWIL